MDAPIPDPLPPAADAVTAETPAQRFLPDMIYGANDGLITTFAIVAGVVGASLSSKVILILGFANLLADGFSMGASNLLARRSSSDPAERDGRVALEHGIATWLSFVVAGAVPLLAYVLPIDPSVQFEVAVALTLTTLFVIGAARSIVIDTPWLRNGLEMLVVGAVAAAVAFGIGALGARIVDG